MAFGLFAGIFFLAITSISASYWDIGVPYSNATIDVRAFNVVSPSDMEGPAPMIVDPALPGYERIDFSVYAFLLQHSPSGKQFMWDLGLRSDIGSFAPDVAFLFQESIIEVGNIKDIFTRLAEGNVSLNDIDTVFWSHAHFDHIGDMSKFPNSTNLVVGAGTNLSTYPNDPHATLLASDIEGRNLTVLDFENYDYVFSGIRVLDYFGDGSFYILETPGHYDGHISAIARVTPDSFIVLSSDAFHHVGQMRPTEVFQRVYPCPGDAMERSAHSISTDYFWSHSSDGPTFDLQSRAKPLVGISDAPGAFYVDPLAARISVDKLQRFDADPDFWLIASHDSSISQSIPYFPDSLNSWQEDGLKEQTVWEFLDVNNVAFRFSPKNSTQKYIVYKQ